MISREDFSRKMTLVAQEVGAKEQEIGLKMPETPITPRAGRTPGLRTGGQVALAGTKVSDQKWEKCDESVSPEV